MEPIRLGRNAARDAAETARAAKMPAIAKAAVADGDFGVGPIWADSGRTGVAWGSTGVGAKAVIQFRAWCTPHCPERSSARPKSRSSTVSVILSDPAAHSGSAAAGATYRPSDFLDRHSRNSRRMDPAFRKRQSTTTRADTCLSLVFCAAPLFCLISSLASDDRGGVPNARHPRCRCVRRINAVSDTASGVFSTGRVGVVSLRGCIALACRGPDIFLTCIRTPLGVSSRRQGGKP
jgi:hypothetical protein